jgi:hypothetical protein
LGTQTAGINASGEIVGTYDGLGIQNAIGINYLSQNGFLYSGGHYTTIDDPLGVNPQGVKDTQLTGINAADQIVGDYFDSKGTEHGFVYSDGKYATIDPTGSTNTTISGINDAGQVVGTYTDQSGTHGFIATPQTEGRERKEPPKLTITDHWLSVAASGSVLLPISVKANDTDDTVSVKISSVPSFETITAGDGHAVAKRGDSYTFTLADAQSGLTLHSSFERKYHPEHDGREHDRDEGKHSEHRFAAEQSKLTVTAFNTTQGEIAATKPETITATTTPPTDRLVGLFNQYVAAGFHNDHDGAGQMTSFPDKQGHQENLTFLSNPHH